MKKSVLFIEPSGTVTNVFENYMRLPLTGTLFLGTILHEHGYAVRILNENVLGTRIDPFEVRADVFCITALTVSASRAKFLAGQFKRIYPESTVIIGGIHASLLPDEFTDVADHVVVGEAEEIIVDLVEGKFEQTIVQGTRVADLEHLPLLNYRLLEGYERMNTIPIMTSRGCPFDCSFCTVTKIFGRKFRMISPERIIAEVENGLRCFNSRDVFFYDDNFTANRKRIDRLCDLLIEKDLGINWYAQVRTDLAKDPELVRKMVRAGCRWAYVGFESIDDKVLEAYGKAQTRADVETAIRTFHESGLNIHGMFMFGEDHDTPESIANTVRFAKENDVDTVQFLILTPFPGTRTYDELVRQDRLFHTNWDYYNGMFIVFRPKAMSPLRLQTETYRAFQAFYSLRRTLWETVRLVGNVFCDALVWNFRRVRRFRLDAVAVRAASTVIVAKASPVYKAYLKFLGDLERRQILDGS